MVSSLLFPPVSNMYFDHRNEKKNLLFQIMEHKNMKKPYLSTIKLDILLEAFCNSST